MWTPQAMSLPPTATRGIHIFADNIPPPIQSLLGALFAEEGLHNILALLYSIVYALKWIQTGYYMTYFNKLPWDPRRSKPWTGSVSCSPVCRRVSLTDVDSSGRVKPDLQHKQWEFGVCSCTSLTKKSENWGCVAWMPAINGIKF